MPKIEIDRQKQEFSEVGEIYVEIHPMDTKLPYDIHRFLGVNIAPELKKRKIHQKAVADRAVSLATV